MVANCLSTKFFMVWLLSTSLATYSPVQLPDPSDQLSRCFWLFLCSVFKVKETCILVVVPDLWKSIALIVNCAPSTESFKTRLKTYFPLAFESVWFVHVFVSCVCLAPTMYFTCFLKSIPVSFWFCFVHFTFCMAPEKETRQNKLMCWFYKEDL